MVDLFIRTQEELSGAMRHLNFVCEEDAARLLYFHIIAMDKPTFLKQPVIQASITPLDGGGGFNPRFLWEGGTKVFEYQKVEGQGYDAKLVILSEKIDGDEL